MASLHLHRISRAAAVIAVATLALPGLVSAHNAPSTPTWLTNDSKHHAVTLTLIAAYNNNGSGFNFNGFGHGKMTVTVPVNYTVNVMFSNNAPLPHSVAFTAYSAKLTAQTSFAPTFKGATSPNPTTGTVKGKTDKFSFQANKAGMFAIVCAVPGHVSAGMWDYLKVVASGTPSISTSK